MMMTEAQQVSNYRAVKERLYGRPRVVNVAAEIARQVEKSRRKAREEWEMRQRELAEKQALKAVVKPVEKIAPAPVKVLAVKPLWACCDIHFNQHVVDYLMRQVALERGSDGVPQRRRTMDEITLEVLQDFPGINIDDLKKSRGRRAAYVVPRHIAMYRIYRERLDVSYPEIGRFFGGFDHTSCMHAVKKYEAIFGEIPRHPSGKKRTE